MVEESKSHWNYRIIKKTVLNPASALTEDFYEIHEVYYENGIPNSVTENPVTVCSENIEEIEDILQMMLMATKKPAIPMEYFENLSSDNKDDDSDIFDVDLGGC